MSLLFAYGINRFCHDMAHTFLKCIRPTGTKLVTKSETIFGVKGSNYAENCVYIQT